MRCVNDTFPPRDRVRWLLTTIRLSMRSFAGIARTLVAVGISRLDSMFVTVRAAAPLSRWTSISELVTGRVVGAGGMSRGSGVEGRDGAALGAESGACAGAGAVGAAGCVADCWVGAGTGEEAPFCAGAVGAGTEPAGNGAAVSGGRLGAGRLDGGPFGSWARPD